MAEKKDEGKGTEVQKVESTLPAIPDPETLKEIFEANLEGAPPQFEVIKIPTGGGTAWEIPGEDEETEVTREIVGVILDHYPARAYWSHRFGQGESGGPPECFSLDGKTGSKEREDGAFGTCHDCKWAQFGTAVKDDGSPGRGQACQYRHRVFIVINDHGFFPYLIPLSTMSATKAYAGSFSTYRTKRSSRLEKLTHVVTKIKLIKDKNADGIEYAKAVFFKVGDLSDEEKKQVDWLIHNLKPAMRDKPFDFEEAAEGTTAKGDDDNDPPPWEDPVTDAGNTPDAGKDPWE